MAAAAAAVASAEAEVDDASYAADDNHGQLSPFADADWRFDYDGPGSPNAAYAAAQQQQQQSLMNQTFPDSPQFRTGRVFEIPSDGGLGTSAANVAMAGARMVGQQQPVHYGSPLQLAAAIAAQASGYGGAVGGGMGRMPQGPLPLAQLQLLQQQQYALEAGCLGTQNGAEVRNGNR
jgi:hypothetical protein